MIIAGTILVAVFLAMNMGISGFSVSFAPSFGSNVLGKNRAVLLFSLCLIAGACLFGPRVVETLVSRISHTQLNAVSSGIILISCAVTMYLSNILKVPQSTSFITVASFVGSGLFYGKVNWHTVGKILAFAVIFSAVSFVLTIMIKRGLYPPRQGNLRFYEKFFVHREKFRRFIVYTDMYSAFGVGTNNVANVVAPLVILLGTGNFILLLAFGPLFGLGAYFGGERVIRSLSKDIVPVGEASASIVSVITATFVLVASILGLPTPYVQFMTFSLLGISCAKDGFRNTFGKTLVKRILWIWVMVPVFTALLSFCLHFLFLRGLHLS